MTVPPTRTAVRPDSGPVALFKLFWSGFTTPTYAAFAGIVIVFLLCVAMTIAFVTPRTLGGRLGDYLPRSTRDAEGFATHEALRLAFRSPPSDTRLHVAIISDSILAHAFASDTRIAADVAAATGGPAAVGFMATPGQGPVDEAALADYATRVHPGIVVLSLFYGRYGQPNQQLLELDRMARLGIRSPWADAAIVRLGGTPRPVTGYYLLDNRNFVLRNVQRFALRVLFNAPPVRRIDVFTRAPGQRPDFNSKTRAFELSSLRETGEISRRANAVILGDTVHNLQARGNRVILFQAPVNESIFEAGDAARYEAYLARSAALAHNLGAFYCHLAGTEKVPAAAFYDPVHIVDPVQQARLRLKLASCIADVAAGRMAQ